MNKNEKRTHMTFSIAETEKDSDFSHGNSSNLGAFFNIVCTIAGTGILSLPNAISVCGWPSLTLIILGALGAFYSGILIIECLYYKDERLDSYPEVGEAAFGLWGKYFVLINHYAIVLGSVATYIALTGEHIHKFVNGPDYQIFYWKMLAGFIIAIPYISLKSLKEVTILSVFGVLATIIVVIIVPIIVLDYRFKTTDIITYGTFDFMSLPKTLSTVAFSFGGSVVFPHVEQSMRSPNKWKSVLALSITFICFMYIFFSAIGFFGYGVNVKSPIFINLDITQSNFTSISAIISMVFITVHVILASPVYLCTFGVVFEDKFNITVENMGKYKEFFIRALTRSMLMIILTIVAACVGNFKSLANIVGAVNNGVIIFIVPVACHLKLFGYKNRSIYQYAAFAGLFCLGIICLTFGTYYAINDYISTLSRTKFFNKN